jgi:hypothetical protein
MPLIPAAAISTVSFFFRTFTAGKALGTALVSCLHVPFA